MIIKKSGFWNKFGLFASEELCQTKLYLQDLHDHGRVGAVIVVVISLCQLIFAIGLGVCCWQAGFDLFKRNRRLPRPYIPPDVLSLKVRLLGVSSYAVKAPNVTRSVVTGFVIHALLLRMNSNVVDFRVMRRLCHREWNWQWNWQSVNHIPRIYDNGPRDHGVWRLTLTAYWVQRPQWVVSKYGIRGRCWC